MALKSMKTTAADRKAEKERYDKPCSIGGEDYPYGLRIQLDERSIKKLGLGKLPKAGTYVTVTAECCVQSVSINERDGKMDRSLSLQIEEMDVKVPNGTLEDAIDDAINEADED